MPRQAKPTDEHCTSISISFTPDQLAEVQAYCQKHERAMAWVIRKALAEWLGKHKDDPVC